MSRGPPSPGMRAVVAARDTAGGERDALGYVVRTIANLDTDGDELEWGDVRPYALGPCRRLGSLANCIVKSREALATLTKEARDGLLRQAPVLVGFSACLAAASQRVDVPVVRDRHPSRLGQRSTSATDGHVNRCRCRILAVVHEDGNVGAVDYHPAHIRDPRDAVVAIRRRSVSDLTTLRAVCGSVTEGVAAAEATIGKR